MDSLFEQNKVSIKMNYSKDQYYHSNYYIINNLHDFLNSHIRVLRDA